MKAFQLLTDKNHFMTEIEVFPSPTALRTCKLNTAESANTDFRGIGVAITGASCYNLSIMDKSERDAFLKDIYSEEGLGLSIGRLSIGASDYSAELYSYDDTPFDTELKDFSIERDKKYIIPMIKEILQINPDLILFASPWSPPAWMKTGENLCGGYMRREYVECYAEYIVKFIKAYAENGIKISAITPQNEPNSQQIGTMPACVWHPEIEAEFITVLNKKFAENNIDTKIWMFDHNFSDVYRVSWMLKSCDSLQNACNAVAFHYYDGSIEETLSLKKSYPELELHFTEAGPRLYDNYETDFCKWGIMLSKAIKCGYSSFTGWNLMLNEMGGPNIGPFLCGGLVTRHTTTAEFSYSGQYKAFKHIAPYIRKNAEISPLSVGEEYNLEMSVYPKKSFDLEGFCIDNKDGKKVLVVVNPNSEKRQVQFTVDSVCWYAELTPESISTIIISE